MNCLQDLLNDESLHQFIDSAYRRQTQRAVNDSDEKFAKEIRDYMKLHHIDEFNKQKYIYLKESLKSLTIEFYKQIV